MFNKYTNRFVYRSSSYEGGTGGRGDGGAAWFSARGLFFHTTAALRAPSDPRADPDLNNVWTTELTSS